MNYYTRTIPNISNDLRQVDEVITNNLLLAITEGITPTSNERQLFALPPSLGGLGIPIFAEQAVIEFENSQNITKYLQNNIIEQIRYSCPDEKELRAVKLQIKGKKNERNKEKLNNLQDEMNVKRRKLHEISLEKGASVWLTTLPLKDEGFQLDKQAFWDLMKIRYGHQLSRLPERCACGAAFDLQHALSCKKGGFVTQRHNSIRDTTARLLTEVCKDVRVEPLLHPLTGETLQERTANTSEEARLDISARGFWTSGQKAFFDVRVFNPTASRYGQMSTAKMYEVNEKEKKRSYNERIQSVDQGTFTPLVFNAMGGMSRECALFYKRLGELIADKRKQPPPLISKWLSRKISFSLSKSIVICVRGSRKLWCEDELVTSLSNDACDVEKQCDIKL